MEDNKKSDQEVSNDDLSIGSVATDAAVAVGRGATAIRITAELWPLVLVLFSIIAILIIFLVYPFFQSKQMLGEWNIAIAKFYISDSDLLTDSDTLLLSNVFYNRLRSEMEEMGQEINITIEVWGPEEIGVISGDSAEIRSEQAAKIAEKLNVDILVYGVVYEKNGRLRLIPEFYVNVRNFYEAEEMVGQHSLGNEIPILGNGENLPTQLNLNEELQFRSELLSLISQGLSYYSFNDYYHGKSVV